MLKFGRFLQPSFTIAQTSKAFQGRWYQQPDGRRFVGTSTTITSSSEVVESNGLPAVREYTLPKFAPRRGNGLVPYRLVKGRNGELLAGYNLFVDAIRKSELKWHPYNSMTKAEKTIYIAHVKAVEARKLEYVDPHDKKSVHKTVSFHLHQRKCCGEGCRHCPYELEACDPEIKQHLVYNGAYYVYYELSRHRTRPPNPGIHRRTRLLVVDNSAIGKEANTTGRLAYCIHVYKPGFRAKHMPHATLGDLVLVAIKGEMKKALVVGANIHVNYRKHGIPSTDMNNIILFDDDKNPLGTRILAPIPGVLLKKRGNPQYAKALSLATKFF